MTHRNKLECLSQSVLQPSLMYARKSGAYPRVSLLKIPFLLQKYQTRVATSHTLK